MAIKKELYLRLEKDDNIKKENRCCMRRNNSPCPPAPNYARQMGVSDCQFLQLSKRQENDYRTHYLEKPLSLPKNAYLSLGGTPMHHRRNPFGLGRAVLEADRFKMETLRSINRRFSKKYPVTFLDEDYKGFSPTFVKDLWRVQAGIFWLTNGNAYAGQFPSMKDFVTKNGGDPKVLPPNFTNVFDLREVLPNYKGGQYGIYGPDGIWGPATENLLLAYIKNGRSVYGVDIDAGNDNLANAFSRLEAGLSNPKLAAAKSTENKDSIKISPSLETDCSILDGNAQEAAGNCAATKTSLKEDGEIKTKRKGGLYGEKVERNWWIAGGVATAGILLNYHLYRKRFR